MLSNTYIAESIPRKLWDRYSEIETDMILAFAKRARDMDYTALWYADKLQAMGILREDLEKIIAKTWPGTQADLAKALDDAGFKALSADERIFQSAVSAGLLKAAPPIAESIALRATLEAGYRRARDKLNLTNTTAINTTIAALDAAFILANTGTISLQEAIQKAVNELSSSGITGAVYASGRHMELAPYVRMVVRTSVAQTTAEMGFERMAEYGSDLIIVSAHAGARPRCAPYQGRVFSLSGTHKKYKPWRETSYGEAAGLLGINCGHWVDPFIEGLSRMPTAEEQNPASELGKSNSQVYRESQDQRYIERKIRAWKHREAAVKREGLSGKREAAKVKEWQGQMREFIKESDRTRRYDRERV